jgi:ABC-2 type transport system permease protein
MRRYLQVLRAFWSNSLSLDIEYRADFLINLVTVVVSLAAGLLVIAVMFSGRAAIAGWTFEQALTLYGIFLFFEEFSTGFLAVNIGGLPELIRRGDLDFLLLKPMNSQLQVSIRRFSITGLPSYLLGIAVTLYGMAAQGALDASNLLLLAFFVLCAMAIVYAIWALLHTLAFWFVRVENLSQLFYAVFETARFPITVFPRWLRVVFTFIIPVAFITTVPASAAVGTLDWPFAIAAPVIALLGLFASHLLWRFALKHYTSASS